MSDIVLRHAETAEEVASCFPVMALLRPHLSDAAELAARLARQRDAGCRLLAAWRDGAPIALAGYRTEENLVHLFPGQTAGSHPGRSARKRRRT